MEKAETITLVKHLLQGEGFNVYEDPDGNNLFIHVTLDGGKVSSTGKMTLTASSGGWKDIPGTDGVRFNLMLGRRR